LKAIIGTIETRQLEYGGKVSRICRSRRFNLLQACSGLIDGTHIHTYPGPTNERKVSAGEGKGGLFLAGGCAFALLARDWFKANTRPLRDWF
jgi:hypothetical protein